MNLGVMQAYDISPFQGELSSSWVVLCGLLSSILKICMFCIYEVRVGKSPGTGKAPLKCSNKKLVNDNLASRRQKRFDMFMCC